MKQSESQEDSTSPMDEDDIETHKKSTGTNLKYMNRPPRIIPNYGKKVQSVLPKTCVSRVLLYDNVTQQQMLDVKLTQLRHEQQKAGRLLDLHRKSFILRRLMKQQYALAHQTRVDIALGGAYTSNRTFDNTFNGIKKTGKLLNNVQSENGKRQSINTKLPAIDSNRHRRGSLPLKMEHSSVMTASLPLKMEHSSVVTASLPVKMEHFGGTTASLPLKMEHSNGITRLMHTFTEDDNSVALLQWAKRKVVCETRYDSLVKLLVHLDDPGNGYIELSPSFHKKSVVFPKHVIAFSTARTADENLDV